MPVKADKIKNKYQTLDPAQFPATASQDEGSELRIKAEMLLESMKRVSYAVPAQNTNTVMTAMCAAEISISPSGRLLIRSNALSGMMKDSPSVPSIFALTVISILRHFM